MPTVAHAAAVQRGVLAVADALEAAQDATVPAPRASLRDAAAAMREEWDDRDNSHYGLQEAIERLRATLATKPGRAAREPDVPRLPREGTKQEAVLTPPRRDEGATVAQIAEAMGWASHTVRGFLAGLKKKDFQVTTLESVRMVGCEQVKAKGSYKAYVIVD